MNPRYQYSDRLNKGYEAIIAPVSKTISLTTSRFYQFCYDNCYRLYAEELVGGVKCEPVSECLL